MNKVFDIIHQAEHGTRLIVTETLDGTQISIESSNISSEEVGADNPKLCLDAIDYRESLGKLRLSKINGHDRVYVIQ